MKEVRFGDLKNGDIFYIDLSKIISHFWSDEWPCLKNTFMTGNCCTITPNKWYTSRISSLEDNQIVLVKEENV